MKIFLAAVTLTEVKLIWLMYVGLFFNRFINITDKNLPNQKMTVCATVKKFKCKKSFSDCGDLENKVKVKLMKAIKVLPMCILGINKSIS